MSSITSDDVRHVARLARLRIDEDQIDSMAGELDQIIDSMSKLRELDLANVEPTTHALEVVNVFADDVVRPSLANDAALSNAPDAVDGVFRVPQMQS